MSYRTQYLLTILIAVTIAGLAIAIAANNPLGLSQKTLAILGIAAAVLGALQSFLPRLPLSPTTREKKYQTAKYRQTLPEDVPDHDPGDGN